MSAKNVDDTTVSEISPLDFGYHPKNTSKSILLLRFQAYRSRSIATANV